MAIHGGRRRGEVWRARIGEAEEGMKGKGVVRDLQQERKGIKEGDRLANKGEREVRMPGNGGRG